MQKSDSIKELATALAKAQGQLENASKASVNPHFKSKYADLAEVINTIRPVFAEHGLSVMQCPSFDAGIVSVETVLMHSSGEFIASTVSAPVSKQDAQGVGSAITYCRRYALAAVAGIAQEDDDANGAVGKAPAKPVQPQSKAGKPKPTLEGDRFKNALDKVKSGEFPWERLASDYDLTEAQREELRIVVESL